MHLSHYIRQSTGELLEATVDFKKNDWVFLHAYVYSIDGRTATNISELFWEHMNGEQILEGVDWREKARHEHIEEAA